MAGGSSIQIGAVIREDATGTWHQATLEDRPYTLRILRAELAGKDEARLVFEQEMRRIEGLRHDALIRVHRVGRKPPRPWMLTDPIDGRTLDEALVDDGPLALESALALARTLHEGSRFLQGRGQVHAAPWPTRWVEVEGVWRLPTFRAIRAVDGLKSLKRRGSRDETYGPPENATKHPAKLRVEPWIAWSVGVLLRAASGRDPATRAATERLCDPDPERRPAGARAVEAALAAVGAAEASPEVQAPVRRRRRDRSP